LPLLLSLLLAASALGHYHPLPLPDDQPTDRPFCRVCPGIVLSLSPSSLWHTTEKSWPLSCHRRP